MKKLNELSDGSCGRVVAINGDAHFQSRVTSIGLTIGCPFEVIQNPKKRPVLVYARDTMVAIYKVGTFIEPVTSLFGLPWQLFIAFVASAMGKEASLGVMASLFNTGSIWAAIEQSATVDTAALSTSMLSVISRPEALAFLFAFFFNMPCLMALTATTQETHSMKWTVRIALYYVLTALIMATIAYHVGLVIF